MGVAWLLLSTLLLHVCRQQVLLQLGVRATDGGAERAAQRFAALVLAADVLLQLLLSAQHGCAVRTVHRRRCAWRVREAETSEHGDFCKLVFKCPALCQDLDQVGALDPGLFLTLVLGSLVLGQRGCVGEELEADVTLDQGLELPGVAGEHLRVVGSVVVPQTRQLLRQRERHLAGK